MEIGHDSALLLSLQISTSFLHRFLPLPPEVGMIPDFDDPPQKPHPSMDPFRLGKAEFFT
jgi:hypothetical protein